jgi:hypothetical protein
VCCRQVGTPRGTMTPMDTPGTGGSRPHPRPKRSRQAFDATALYAALDRARTARKLSWRELSKQAGVGATGVGTQLAAGRQPSAGVLALLLLWLGDLSIAPYVPDAAARARPAPPAPREPAA